LSASAVTGDAVATRCAGRPVVRSSHSSCASAPPLSTTCGALWQNATAAAAPACAATNCPAPAHVRGVAAAWWVTLARQQTAGAVQHAPVKKCRILEDLFCYSPSWVGASV
jgi:hypothetical protein